MGIKERIAAIEEKLGIEVAKDAPCIAWDRGDMFDGAIYSSGCDDDGEDRMDNWDHIVYLPPKIVAAIKALPEAKK